MSLIFTDGYDDGLTTQKGSAVTVASAGTGAVVAAGRTGANCFRTTSNGLGASWARLTNVLPASAQHATMTLGVAFRPSALGTHNTNTFGVMALAGDSGATNHMNVALTATGALDLRRGTTVLASTAGALIVANEWHYLELKVTLSDTVGVATVRLNGTQVLTFSGDTKNAGTGTVLDAYQLGGPSASANYDFDDLFLLNGAGTINNDFLGDCRVETLLPNGNGASSAWVGSDANSVDNYLLVNEAVPSLTEFVESATVGAVDTYAFANAATAAGSVPGVMVSALARTDAGAANVALVSRSGTDQADGGTQALSTTAVAVRQSFELQPVTAAAWTLAAVNGAEFGMKIVA